MFTRGYQRMTWDIWNCTLTYPDIAKSYCGWLKAQQKTMGCANHLWTGASDFAGPSTVFFVLRFPNLEMCWFFWQRTLTTSSLLFSSQRGWKPPDFLVGSAKSIPMFRQVKGNPNFEVNIEVKGKPSTRCQSLDPGWPRRIFSKWPTFSGSIESIGTPFLVLVPSTWCQGTRQLLSKDA